MLIVTIQLDMNVEPDKRDMVKCTIKRIIFLLPELASIALLLKSCSALLRTYVVGCLFSAKQWKRMVTKVTFVGPGFTRKPPKYERFIRPTELRFNKAHVTHPELKCTFNLEIIGVKKNPNGPMYTSLGVLTKGTIIEVRFPPPSLELVY